MLAKMFTVGISILWGMNAFAMDQSNAKDSRSGSVDSDMVEIDTIEARAMARVRALQHSVSAEEVRAGQLLIAHAQLHLEVDDKSIAGLRNINEKHIRYEVAAKRIVDGIEYRALLQDDTGKANGDTIVATYFFDRPGKPLCMRHIPFGSEVIQIPINSWFGSLLKWRYKEKGVRAVAQLTANGLIPWGKRFRRVSFGG